MVGKRAVRTVAASRPGTDVSGVPIVGGSVSTTLRGFVGAGVGHGWYVVADVEPDVNQATASWEWFAGEN